MTDRLSPEDLSQLRQGNLAVLDAYRDATGRLPGFLADSHGQSVMVQAWAWPESGALKVIEALTAEGIPPTQCGDLAHRGIEYLARASWTTWDRTVLQARWEAWRALPDAPLMRNSAKPDLWQYVLERHPEDLADILTWTGTIPDATLVAHWLQVPYPLAALHQLSAHAPVLWDAVVALGGPTELMGRLIEKVRTLDVAQVPRRGGQLVFQDLGQATVLLPLLADLRDRGGDGLAPGPNQPYGAWLALIAPPRVPSRLRWSTQDTQKFQAAWRATWHPFLTAELDRLEAQHPAGGVWLAHALQEGDRLNRWVARVPVSQQPSAPQAWPCSLGFLVNDPHPTSLMLLAYLAELPFPIGLPWEMRDALQSAKGQQAQDLLRSLRRAEALAERPASPRSRPRHRS